MAHRQINYRENESNLTIEEILKLVKLYNKLSVFKIDVCKTFEIRYELKHKDHVSSEMYYDNYIDCLNNAPLEVYKTTFEIILTTEFNKNHFNDTYDDNHNRISFPYDAFDHINIIQDTIYEVQTGRLFRNESGVKIILSRLSSLVNNSNDYYMKFKEDTKNVNVY